MRRVYISDVHLGKCDPKYSGNKNYVWFDIANKVNDLAAFLAYVKEGRLGQVDEFVLVGDILDDWVVPADVMPPTFDEILDANPKIVDAINALLDSGMKVRYIPGNHDMGISKEKGALGKHFGRDKDGNMRITFGGNTKNYSELRYKAGKVICEHGTTNAMFNGPDKPHGGTVALPLGYFLSRLSASTYVRTGRKVSEWDVVRRVFQMFTNGELLSGREIVETALRIMCDGAGMNFGSRILVRPGKTFADKSATYVTVNQVYEEYDDIYANWGNRKADLLDKYQATSVDAHNVALMVEPLCKELKAGVAVMGHTHDERLIEYPRDYPKHIYVNTGCWCKKTKTVTAPNGGRLTTGSGHFGVTDDAQGVTEARLYFWNTATGRPKQSYGVLKYPLPKPAPMSGPVS